MLARTHIARFYGISLAFVACCIWMLTKELYWVAAIPALLLVLYFAVYSIDKILWIVVFSTPLAIVLNDKSTGPALSMPTEPLLFGVLLLFIFKFIFEGGFDRRILYHPVTVSIGFLVLWKFITSLTSSMPGVSFKHLVSQLWFIVPMYLLGTQLFRDKKNIKRFIWLYSIPLLIVVGYTIVRHAQNGWTQQAAHWVMIPFYNDHTAYAAALAMFIPPLIAFTRMQEESFSIRTLAFLVTAALAVALILSYTRAAWLSLVAALGLFLVYYFRIRFWTVFTGLTVVLALFFSFQKDIFMKLEKNRQDSATDFNKHLQSISNISTDASNLERINRWNSALRMFEERPFWGWGPGTYQFNYAPFQKSDEMTIISTNAGNRGNAHSEYIGPLAESGVFGLVTVAALLIALIYTASISISRSHDPVYRTLLLGVFLGLVTYFVHGALNNFLDTDKLSVPVWAFMAMVVAMDVYHTPMETKPLNGKSSLLGKDLLH
ncbi:MAG: O-antigen ligase family protein [Candidatus Pollutiaquabacter aromativorans]